MRMKSSKKSRGRPQDTEHYKLQNEKILLAATKVFSDKGYAGTEMQKVADKAGVAKGTLYLYFKSKKDLFFAVLDRFMLLLREKIHEELLNVLDPIEHFRLNIICILNFFDKYPELIELLIQERAVFKNWEKSVFFKHGQDEMQIQCRDHEELIKSGKIRNITKEGMFTVYSDLIYGAIMNKISVTGKFTKLSDKSNSMIDICLNGILSDQERKRNLGF